MTYKFDGPGEMFSAAAASVKISRLWRLGMQCPISGVSPAVP